MKKNSKFEVIPIINKDVELVIELSQLQKIHRIWWLHWWILSNIERRIAVPLKLLERRKYFQTHFMGPDIKVRQKHHKNRKLQANTPDKYMQKYSAEY